ncbi:colicin E3/pyocin S6 family cytotoxin [Aliivibrio fischeri]|uniref:colicin E3/pyocin S6 family cytotoxin n=1 Tax=Aliivibrio fischeri TaxID=668 RepID=UPI001F378474|nr:colicin E3/pyocin S6 family cytotoxin [Aliivibrio fischeri]
MEKVWNEELGCFSDNTEKKTTKIINAYFPWNEELAKESKPDIPHYEPVKEPQSKIAAFEYSIEIACSQDELNTYQIGHFSLGKTKAEESISSWHKTQTDEGFTLFTSSIKVNEPKKLYREFFCSCGNAILFDDVKPVKQGSGSYSESFVPIKPAVQVCERLGWPTEGYFYHFIDDVLVNEYKLKGSGKWAFQVTCSTKDTLTDELVSGHDYAFILLPWKINNVVIARQHLLYLPQKMSSEYFNDINSNWLDTHACLLDVNAIVQSKYEDKLTREQEDETLPAATIKSVGQSISFDNTCTASSTPKLRHNVVPAIKDNAIPQRTPIVNVCKIDPKTKATEFGDMAFLAMFASTTAGASSDVLDDLSKGAARLFKLSSNVGKKIGDWVLSGNGVGRLGGGIVTALWPSQLGDGTLDGGLQFDTSNATNVTVRFNLYKDENGVEQVVGIHSGDGYAYGGRVDKKAAVRHGDKFVIELEEGITLTWVPDGEEYKLDPSTELPEYDGLDVHDVWVRPIEEHKQELGTILYPEDELVEYIVTFPVDAGLPPLYLVFNKPSADLKFIPAPRGIPPLPAFPSAKPAKPKTKVQGGGKLRERWIDKKGRIYEWDYQHGKVEVYDKTGQNHLGEFDHKTGEQTKKSDPKRRTNK